MKIHSLEHEFCYIDPNQAYIDGAVEGDGTTPESPLWNFPAQLQDNKIYLVRRSVNGYVATVSNASTADDSVRSLVIWGMPTPGDSWYDMVPDEVKEVWTESATNSKAYVKFVRDSGRNTLTAPYVNNFDIRGFEFLVQGDCRSYHALNVGSSAGTCNSHIENITFRDSESDFTIGQKPADWTRGDRFIYISNQQWAHVAKMINCKIIAYVQEDSVYLGRAQYVHIEGCEINICQRYDSSVGVVSWCRDDYQNAAFVTIKDCNVYLYNVHDQSDSFRPIFTGHAMTLTAIGLTYQMATTQYWNAYSNRMYVKPLISVTLRSPGSVIEDITCDFSEVIAGGCNSLINLHYSPNYDTEHATFGQYTIVRNITINASRSPRWSDGTSVGGGGYVWNVDSNNRGLLKLTSDSYERGSSSDYLVQDLHISAPRGIAMHAVNALLDLKSCDIEGSIELRRCTGKLGNISTWYPGYAVADSGGNILYIKSITCNRTNPSYEYNGQYALIPSYRSNVLCGTTNTIFMPPDTMPTNQTRARNSYICTNDQIAGNYTVRNSFSECRTWSVNRVGSVGGCSLKLINESGVDDTKFPLVIAGEPFKGISIAASSGDRVAVIYLAMYGYNDFTQVKDKFRIKITKPDGSFVTSMDGNWSEDSDSQWINVEGHTQYKCEIPFTLEEDCEVQFEYQFSWYMQGGVTYLDPYPEII